MLRGDLDIFQLRYDIRYTFPHGCNASAILLKASGSTLPGIGSGSDDEALENSASITILDSPKAFGCTGRNSAFAWKFKAGSIFQASDEDQQEGERTVVSNGNLTSGGKMVSTVNVKY